MNIPTFSLYQEIGFEKVDSIWKKMGFTYSLDNTPSLPMGTAEASIKEVAVAYASFANGGFRIRPYCISSIKSPDGELIYNGEEPAEKEKIISDRSCQLMSAMLQKAIRDGTGVSMNSVYGVSFPLAGKTGTSQDYADAWFAAFNPKLVIVSRAGASTRAIHFSSGSNGSGSALALPLVALTLKKVSQNPELTKSMVSDFPELPPELAGALDCPDFKDKNLFDRIKDVFEKNKKTYDDSGAKTKTRTKRKKDSFFRKIFRK